MFDPGMMYLSKAEEDMFLEHFQCSDTATLSREQFEFFRCRTILTGTLGGSVGWFDTLPASGVCELSDNGRRYRAWLLETRHDRKVSNTKDAVALAISFLALAVSVVSILL